MTSSSYSISIFIITAIFMVLISAAENIGPNGSPSGTLNTIAQQVQPKPVLAATSLGRNISLDPATLPIKPLLQAALSIGQNVPNIVAPTLQPTQPVQQQVASKPINKSGKQNLKSTGSRVETQPVPSVAVTQNTVSHNANIDEPVVQVDYSSINDEVLMKKTASFVYFNANFNSCRHCHNFYSIWKDLAIDLRWWRNIVRFFVINCSEEDNIELCRRTGVTQFPQVRFYWIMSSSLDQDGQRMRILGKSVHAMRHLVTDKIVESYQEHNKLLAQRGQNPLGAMSGLLSGLGGGASKSSGASSPDLGSLMSLLPMFTQAMGGNQQQHAGSSSSSTAGIGGLLQAFGIGKASGSGNNGASNTPSLANLVGGLHLNMQSVSQLMNALTGLKTTQRKLTLKPIPNNWPDIEPIEASDMQKLLDVLPLDPAKPASGALLIMETPEFLYTGLEVMFDLNPYSNQTYIARVKDDKSLLSKNLTNRDDIQAPAVIYVTSTRQIRLIMTAPKYTDDEDLRRVFVRAFERRQVKYPVKRVWFSSSSDPRTSGSSNSLDNPEDDSLIQKSNQVYMNDLINAIRASLMEQVFRHPDLSDDQYNALVRYVYTLINYFPFSNDESLKFFKRLHTWLQNQVSPVDVSSYKKQFHDIDDVFKKREWIACKSLSNSNAIPTKSRKAGLFDNPAQLGKVVSNFTRMFRGQHKQIANLKNLFSSFTSNMGPVMLTNRLSGNKLNSNKTDSAWFPNIAGDTSGANKRTDERSPDTKSNDCSDSPIERIIKSLTSGSLGSDSSLLKLISAALTGGTNNTKSKFAREYPCGMWKLAHVMVVNEYIKDSPRRDVKHIVLQSLCQYMLNFYACPTCGNRVSDVSNEMRMTFESPQDQADSIMLLWKHHNRVNKRLESENRPGTPMKQQYPPESLCPKCRSARNQNDLVSTPNWNEKQVLNFLVHNYRPQSIISVEIESTTADDGAPSLWNFTWTTLLFQTLSTTACIWWLSR